MKPTEREPSQDELLAMAYADGELPPDERAQFERRLGADARLAREVARYRSLQVLAREVVPPEPMDFEWRRLARDPLQRALALGGWLLAALGALGLVGWGEYVVAISSMPLLPKLALGGLVLGIALLFAAAIRARLRTRAYDPYTEVQR
jgi:anti-sigma factor RsiW